MPTGYLLALFLDPGRIVSPSHTLILSLFLYLYLSPDASRSILDITEQLASIISHSKEFHRLNMFHEFPSHRFVWPALTRRQFCTIIGMGINIVPPPFSSEKELFFRLATGRQPYLPRSIQAWFRIRLAAHQRSCLQ